jgi:preprotein translocase subunit SecA
MGQKDPLTEWQREGFEMFGSMMKGIAQDFVRYVMHVQVVQQPAAPAATPTQETGPSEPGTGPAAVTRPTAASSTSSRAPAPAAPAPAPAAPAARPAPAVRNVQTSSSASQQQSGFAAAAGADAVARSEPGAVLRSSSAPRIEQTAGTSRQGNRPAKQETVVKDEWSKTPRNAPCPCGSGKKFKMCHGAS